MYNMQNKSLQPLAMTFAISGLWDAVAGVIYLFFIGIGRKIDNPTIDPFFSIVLGSFFLCFAYLQFFSTEHQALCLYYWLLNFWKSVLRNSTV